VVTVDVLAGYRTRILSDMDEDVGLGRRSSNVLNGYRMGDLSLVVTVDVLAGY
jgi:hypothetical protein